MPLSVFIDLLLYCQLNKYYNSHTASYH